MSIPAAVIGTVLYLLLRGIRPVLLQVLVSAVAALIFTIVYLIVFLTPPLDATFFIAPLLRISIHPLWVIVPLPLLKKYYTIIRPEIVVFLSTAVVITILVTIGLDQGQFILGMGESGVHPSLFQATIDALLIGVQEMALALLPYAAFLLLNAALESVRGDGYGE